MRTSNPTATFQLPPPRPVASTPTQLLHAGLAAAMTAAGFAAFSGLDDSGRCTIPTWPHWSMWDAQHVTEAGTHEHRVTYDEADDIVTGWIVDRAPSHIPHASERGIPAILDALRADGVLLAVA